MVNRLVLTNRKLLGIALVCIVMVASLTIFLHTGQVEAALLEPHADLVGLWSLDEGSGSITKDSSGLGNDGIVYGATWVTGKYGKALSFDGVNDYVGVASFPSLTGTTVTVQAWMNLSSQVMQYPDVVEIMQDWSPIGGIKIQVSDYTKLTFRVRNGVANKEANTPLWTIETGSWHLIVGTYDDQYSRLYVDGALFSTSSLVENALNLGSPHLEIGRGWDYYIKGVIDEVNVYNRVLTSVEIQNIYQKGPNFSSKLTAKVSKGTTQIMVTLSWQGTGSINATITSPSKLYTEDNSSIYQKSVYSSTDGISNILNIKRLSISVNALSSNENWYITLATDNAEDYKITVETQK